MSVEEAGVLDRLAANERCLGAIFLTYSFDPAFFEDHVLRAALDLRSDPTEQTVRYLNEATRAIQEVPVAVMTDAGMRQPGRRLPYDILDVSVRTFHPKLVLLVFSEFARVQVGSGNLTAGGYGDNRELFVSLDLHYASPTELGLLDDVVESLGRVRSLSPQRGGQFEQVQAELHRRCAEKPRAANTSIHLLDSTRQTSILDQALQLLPNEASISGIGVLAPFFEQDSAQPNAKTSSLLMRLAEIAGPEAELEIGVVWENPPLHPTGEPLKLSKGLGRLWAYQEGEGEQASLEHLTPIELKRTRVHYVSDAGNRESWSLAEAQEAIEDRRLWPAPTPLAYAPSNTLSAAKEAFAEFQLWLHPTGRLHEGRPRNRRLHAKLFLFNYELNGSEHCLVVMGSANASRKAMMLSTAQSGNVELCVAFTHDACLQLLDFAQELVAAPLERVDVTDREFPEAGPNYGLAIEAAEYDAAADVLVIYWASEFEQVLPSWALSYRDKPIASGDSLPAAETVVPAFKLHPSSAELLLVVGDSTFPVPILVADLSCLSVGPQIGQLSIAELLLLCGRRVGIERLSVLRGTERADGVDADDPLGDVFGDDFGPTDVFRAWWSLADELSSPDTTLGGFRRTLNGELGTRAIWGRLKSAGLGNSSVSKDHAWFYGAELHRELSLIRLPEDASGDAKNAILNGFLSELRAGLVELAPAGATPKWRPSVHDFYGVCS